MGLCISKTKSIDLINCNQCKQIIYEHVNIYGHKGNFHFYCSKKCCDKYKKINKLP